MIKGIVDPKIVFTHPHVIPNLYKCISHAEQKMFKIRKKFIQVWNNIKVSKWWQNMGGGGG